MKSFAVAVALIVAASALGQQSPAPPAAGGQWIVVPVMTAGKQAGLARQVPEGAGADDVRRMMQAAWADAAKIQDDLLKGKKP